MPVNWPAYTTDGGYYLEINSDLNKNSVKQNLRSRYVTYWNTVYQNLPVVANASQTLELLWS